MSYLREFDTISKFEQQLAAYTGAPFAIMIDCCTHAIELCFRHDKIRNCSFTAFTYLSIPMTMHKLNVRYSLENEQWAGEYHFHDTRIWDSARRLEKNMYRPRSMQCLSFGYDKPLQIGRGGAILLDDREAYETLRLQRYDGRDLSISPWVEQKTFHVGYHYKPTIEEAAKGLELLEKFKLDPQSPKYHQYPDLRNISIVG